MVSNRGQIFRATAGMLSVGWAQDSAGRQARLAHQRELEERARLKGKDVDASRTLPQVGSEETKH